MDIDAFTSQLVVGFQSLIICNDPVNNDLDLYVLVKLEYDAGPGSRKIKFNDFSAFTYDYFTSSPPSSVAGAPLPVTTTVIIGVVPKLASSTRLERFFAWFSRFRRRRSFSDGGSGTLTGTLNRPDMPSGDTGTMLVASPPKTFTISNVKVIV